MEKQRKVSSKYVWEVLASSGLDVFKPVDISNLLNIPKSTTYRKAAEMTAAGFARNVRHGLYVLVDMKGQTPHPFTLATQAVIPSYVSYLSALNYHGLSEQVPRVVQMASTVRGEAFDYENMRIEYHRVKPEKFYGYILLAEEDSTWMMALPEKAIIDSFDNPGLAGGMEEMVDMVMQSYHYIDHRTMVKLLKDYPSRSTISRVCCILEIMGQNLDSLQKFSSRTPILLIPGKNKNTRAYKRWNVHVEEEVIERLQENR